MVGNFGLLLLGIGLRWILVIWLGFLIFVKLEICQEWVKGLYCWLLLGWCWWVLCKFFEC